MQVSGITLIFVGMALTFKKSKNKTQKLKKKKTIEDDARVL